MAPMNIKRIFLSCSLAAGLFVLGAFWAVTEAPPYGYLSKLKNQVFVLDEQIRPNSLISSNFATLELNSFTVGDELSIERRGGGI